MPEPTKAVAKTSKKSAGPMKGSQSQIARVDDVKDEADAGPNTELPVAVQDKNIAGAQISPLNPNQPINEDVIVPEVEEPEEKAEDEPEADEVVDAVDQGMHSSYLSQI